MSCESVFALNLGIVSDEDTNGMFKVTFNQGFQHWLDGQFADFLVRKLRCICHGQ